MKRGLVLEGGAMRGLWTAGVTDVMMEHDIWPDGLIGVSAGAAFGCNYKSRQSGRAIRYNTRFARDSRYSGMKSWLTSGNYYNAEFGYHTMPKELDVFDNDAFNTNPMAFYVVCTDVLTGGAVYQELTEATEDTYDWIRANGINAVGLEGGRATGQETAGRWRGRLYSVGIFRVDRLSAECGYPDAACRLSEGTSQADAPDAIVAAPLSEDG